MFSEKFNLSTPGKCLFEMFNLSTPKKFFFEKIQSLHTREILVWNIQCFHTGKCFLKHPISLHPGNACLKYSISLHLGNSFLKKVNLYTPGKCLPEIFNDSTPEIVFWNLKYPISLHPGNALKYSISPHRKMFAEIINVSTPGDFFTPWKINLSKRNTPAEGGGKFSFVGKISAICLRRLRRERAAKNKNVVEWFFPDKSLPDETSNRILHRLLVCHSKYEANICSHRYPFMKNYLGVPIGTHRHLNFIIWFLK